MLAPVLENEMKIWQDERSEYTNAEVTQLMHEGFYIGMTIGGFIVGIVLAFVAIVL